MRRTFLLTLLSAFSVASRALAQLVVKPPAFDGRRFDERPSDLTEEPQLAAAVADLLEAVMRRDATLVEPWLADEVYPIGDEEKKEWPKSRVLAHMQTWDAEMWEEVGRALRTGVQLDKDGGFAIAPFADEVVNDLEDVVVVSEGVNVHLRAEASSPILATVGYVVLPPDQGGPFCDIDSVNWVCVGTTQGTRGYIPRALVHVAGDVAVHFSRLPQGWRVVAWGAQAC
jgi:hypothetical protein